jgi:hypothetical protein
MSDQISKHDHVLLALTMNLQSMAMVQLGKVTNPASGDLERDLEGARGSIDILEMLKHKCRTDTPEAVLQVLDRAVMDLQMNYVDELKKERHQEPRSDADADADSAAETDDQPDESHA